MSCDKYWWDISDKTTLRWHVFSGLWPIQRPWSSSVSLLLAISLQHNWSVGAVSSHARRSSERDRFLPPNLDVHRSTSCVLPGWPTRCGFARSVLCFNWHPPTTSVKACRNSAESVKKWLGSGQISSWDRPLFTFFGNCMNLTDRSFTQRYLSLSLSLSLSFALREYGPKMNASAAICGENSEPTAKLLRPSPDVDPGTTPKIRFRDLARGGI